MSTRRKANYSCVMRAVSFRIVITETGQGYVQQSPEVLVHRVRALVWIKSLLIAR